MSIDSLIVLAAVAVAITLTGFRILRAEVVAILAVAGLTLAGASGTDELLAGFGSPAPWIWLGASIVAAALVTNGWVDRCGEALRGFSGSREVQLMSLLMLVAAALAAFVPGPLVVASLMPTIASLSRRGAVSPSRLFLPVAFAAILGGGLTLVGSPALLATSDLLSRWDEGGLGLFTPTLVGLLVVVVGIAYVTTVGRRLLPKEAATAFDPEALVGESPLDTRATFALRVQPGWAGAGRPLAESAMQASSVKLIGYERSGSSHREAAGAETVLEAGDVLLVEARLSDLDHLVTEDGLAIDADYGTSLPPLARTLVAVRARLRGSSSLVGSTLAAAEFRQRFGLVVLAIRRFDRVVRDQLHGWPLGEGDEILALGHRWKAEDLVRGADFEGIEIGLGALDDLPRLPFFVAIPPQSSLIGTTLASGVLGAFEDLFVLGHGRRGDLRLASSPDVELGEGDRLLVVVDPELLQPLVDAGDVEIGASLGRRSTPEQLPIAEAAVAPGSLVIGRRLGELKLGSRFGVGVLALSRDGAAVRGDRATVRLDLGDALLLQGERESLRDIAAEDDFVVLAEAVHKPRRGRAAPVALLALLVFAGLAVAGVASLPLAALTGGFLALALAALEPHAFYRRLDWPTFVLIGAWLSLATAMLQSGAASVVATAVLALTPGGALTLLGVLATAALLLGQRLPAVVAAAVVGPVALEAAAQLAVSARPMLVAAGMAAATGSMSYRSHPVQQLVMAAGGYRKRHYLLVGVGLAALTLLTLVAAVPRLFPL